MIFVIVNIDNINNYVDNVELIVFLNQSESIRLFYQFILTIYFSIAKKLTHAECLMIKIDFTSKGLIAYID